MTEEEVLNNRSSCISLSMVSGWSMVGGELGLILLNTFPTVVVTVYVRWSNQAFQKRCFIKS
jgi:hypothetical protein